jgi:hypothetical protein
VASHAESGGMKFSPVGGSGPIDIYNLLKISYLVLGEESESRRCASHISWTPISEELKRV